MAKSVKLSHPGDRERQRRAGFTLIELAVVLAILTIAVLGTLATIGAVFRQNQSAMETDVATQAVRSKLEEMRAVDYSSLWASYQPGGAIGNTFDVAGLPAPLGGGPQGLVAFLGEADVQAQWGQAADLDGDGGSASAAPTDAARAASWTALPVRVRVMWSDRAPSPSNRAVTVTAIIYDQNR